MLNWRLTGFVAPLDGIQQSKPTRRLRTMSGIVPFRTARPTLHDTNPRTKLHEIDITCSALHYLASSKHITERLRPLILAEHAKLRDDLQTIGREAIEEEGKYPVSIAKLLDG